jgi:hypothetical protein
MSFREDFPYYEAFQDGKYIYTKMPSGVVSALKGLILRFAETSKDLKKICNDIAICIPHEPTTNWGQDFLINDLGDLLDALSTKKIYKFMDYLISFVQTQNSFELVEDLNNLFEENSFGYRIVYDKEGWFDCYWQIYKEPERIIEPITVAIKETEDICAQAKSHLEQAKEQLRKTDNPRAMKDALRDCLSAMEALVKKLSGSDDFDNAINLLKSDDRWSPKNIIRDDSRIWNKIHSLYPDIRHGTAEPSNISKEEAYYWIDRLIAFVVYLARKNKEISKP